MVAMSETFITRLVLNNSRLEIQDWVKALQIKTNIAIPC